MARPLHSMTAAMAILFLLAHAQGFPNHDGISSAYYNCKRVSSLLHSILCRVAELRKRRGDFEGARRAKDIAEGLHSSMKWWKTLGSVGWDYMSHYAWRESFARPSDYADMIMNFNQIISALDELLQLRSETEKMEWMSKNYKHVLKLSKSLLQKLLVIFNKTGPIRESIMTIQKEFSDGDLIGDCLQLAAADVRGVIKIIRDMVTKYFVPSSEGKDFSYSEL